VTKNINKVTEGFKSHHGYIVPIEQIGVLSNTYDEAFRSVLIRKDNIGGLSESVFSMWPFELKVHRKIA
jgi:hypothetical protein